MKVKDLIEVLQKADPESEVCFIMDDGCCGDWLDLDAYDFDILPYSSKELPLAQIRFSPLPGYHSCIQSGGTKEAHEKYWNRFKKK